MTGMGGVNCREDVMVSDWARGGGKRCSVCGDPIMDGSIYMRRAGDAVHVECWRGDWRGEPRLYWRAEETMGTDGTQGTDVALGLCRKCGKPVFESDIYVRYGEGLVHGACDLPSAVGDVVNAPAHYRGVVVRVSVLDKSGTVRTPGVNAEVECIAVIEGLGLGFCLGNALKYLWRAGRKAGSDRVTDLRKARWYLDRAIAGLEGNRE